MNETADPAGGSHAAIPDTVFDEGTELGRRIRSHDWSTTPLGPIEDWPQSLRTAVQIVLSSRYPMFVWWGPAMTNLYNDAYAPILGQRHPDALGKPAREIWPDIWDVVGPLADGVLHEGTSTWNEATQLIMERNGYPEETYFTFSYSPVRDDSGGPGGVFCACSEETARILGERRLRALRALGERSLAESMTIDDACRTAAETLAENPHEFPFALIYLLDATGQQARLVENVSLPLGTWSTPESVTIGSEGDVWGFRTALETGEGVLLEDIETRFGKLPAGPWEEDWTKRALVLPLARSGVQESCAGILVAGLSPRLPFDEEYHGFLDLAAKQIATAIANARAHEEERQRAEALAALDRAKVAFFSNVSHEFRTPLTLILGPLEDLANRTGELSPVAHEQLTLALRNATRLLKLVNTLLDFSRIEDGRIQAIYESTDLSMVTADLAGVFRSTIERAGLRLIVNCPPLDEPVYVDREMWEKVVLNLLSNAFKFTFDGEIEVALRRDNNHALLTVRDTGTGIPAVEIPHLFERFHRIEGARGRSVEGSGIGLALVQELVKLHEGTVEVESEVGRGTTFTVALPLGSAHLPANRIGASRIASSTGVRGEAYADEAARWLSEDAALSAEPASPGSPRPSSIGTDTLPRILLADDNADLREYIKRLLGERYDVVAVPDGLAALESARDGRFDLVLADVMMPGLDGFGLLRALREDEKTRELPIILLSARAGEVSRIEGMEAGADDYLIKPFSAKELLARVDAHLRLRQLREQIEHDLRLKNSQYEALLNEVPLGVYLVDADFKIREINPTALKVFGDIPDILGRDFADVIYSVWEPRFAGELIGLFRHVLETGESFHIPERIERRRDSGVIEYHELQINRIPLPDDRNGVVCYFRDISARVLGRRARVESENALRISEANYRSTFDSLDEGFCLIEIDLDAAGVAVDGLVLEVNPSFERHTGLPAAKGGKVRTLVPHLEQFWLDACGTVVKTGETIRYDNYSDALGRWFATSMSRVGGEGSRQVAVVVNDVTERKLFDQDRDFLLQLGVELQAETDLQRLIDRATRLVGSYFKANRCAWTEVDAARDLLIVRGAHLDGATPIPTERPLSKDSAEIWGRLIDGEIAIIADVATDPRSSSAFTSTSPEARVGAFAAVPFIENGQTVAVLSVSYLQTKAFSEREIVLLQESAARLRSAWQLLDALVAEQAAREKAETAVRARDQFLSIASHELRTPLAGIRGAAQLLQRRQQQATLTDERLAAGVQLINEATGRLGTLVQDLLDVSRLELGDYVLPLEPVDLAGLARQTVERYRPLLDSRHWVSVDAAPDLRPVLANAGAIEQVITNLVDNSAKYSPDGGQIALRLAHDDGGIAVAVEDRGIGISEGVVGTIFEPFGRAENAQSSAIQGMGLGLYICRRILERHGGRIGAVSAGEGKGTTVTFWLPYAGQPS